MNILFVHWLNGIGGGEKYIKNLINALPSNFNISFIGKDKNNLIISKCNKNIKYYYTKFKRNFFIFPLFSIRLFLLLIKVIKKDKIQIIHLNDIYILPTFLIIKKIYPDIEIIFTSHGRWDTHFFFNRMLLKALKFKVIIAPTPIQYFRIKYIPVKVKLLPFFVNKISKKHKRISLEKIKLGIVGRFSPVKNHILAFDIINNLDDKYELHVFGDKILEINEESDEYRKKILGYKNNKRIIFHGFVNNEEEIYKNIDILLVTSISESFGMTTIEALSYGIPVVSTLTEGSVFLIKNNYNGFICENINEFCYNIKYIVSNYEFFSKNCLKEIKSFSKENYINKYIKILKGSE
jgi:UDP-D-galactose:(glucosyl)LPS alpha-1,6-D-galactosyltransferase